MPRTQKSADGRINKSCAPTNWWSAMALGGLMTGGGVGLWSAAAAASTADRMREH